MGTLSRVSGRRPGQTCHLVIRKCEGKSEHFCVNDRKRFEIGRIKRYSPGPALVLYAPGHLFILIFFIIPSYPSNGGRDGGERGRERPRQKLMDWMMEDGYGKLYRKGHNIEKSGVVGHLDLP